MGKYLKTTIGLLIICGHLFGIEKNALINGAVLPISTDSLIAYYPLDNDARDYSGNGLHGTIYGAKPFTDRNARPNPAMYFDGKDDYIDLGNSKKLKPDFPITICVWFKAERKYGQTIFVNNYHENYYYGIIIGVSGEGKGFPMISYGNGGLTTKFGRKSLIRKPDIKLHKWYHITAIFQNNQDFLLFLDGIVQSGEDNGFATKMIYSDGPAYIGKYDTNYDAPPWYFKGAIDELFLFHRELSPDEIQRLMNFTHKPFTGLPD
ncbi:MAG: LamG domain-containing protein [Lentisphaeria bacterium]|nr:LamG domain-containing protein [Candidatus Neomarinimicrobiota bacterium]MCF7842345.1 LamG domain-containing protein [Lentisphaeria bacterium]